MKVRIIRTHNDRVDEVHKVLNIIIFDAFSYIGHRPDGVLLILNKEEYACWRRSKLGWATVEVRKVA